MKFASVRVIALVTMAFSQTLFSQVAAQTRSPRDIQQALVDQGYNPGIPDGVWGKRSATALRDFQRSHGLKATGLIDGPSIGALFDAHEPLETPAVSETPRSNAPAATLPAATTSRSNAPTPTALPPPIQNDLAPVPAVDTTEKSSTVRPPVATPPVEPVPEAPAVPPAATAPPSNEGSGGPILLSLLVLVGIAYYFRRRAKRRRAAIHSVDRAANFAEAIEAGPSTSILANDEPLRFPPQGTKASLKAHDEGVKAWIFQRGYSGPEAEIIPLSATRERTSGKTRNSPWLAAGESVSIGPVNIAGGMIYVGTSLAKRGDAYGDENCLIDPRLPVAKGGDRFGQSMGYWPSYSQISPEARRSYLEWLAGSRSDPDTYIGYVFLYFYGLERRLMLEEGCEDANAVVAEVERLLRVYGSNGSFNRYATELLTVRKFWKSPPGIGDLPEVEGNGFEVPTAVKVALGVRVRDGREIEPDLLLRYAASHPETRVRTPAKRAAALHRALFIAEATRRYPNGIRISAGRFKPIKMEYRACSGSFSLDIPAFGAIPDVTGRAEPITTARAIFESCSDQLDEYSRALGRSPGLEPSLASVAKLPAGLRRAAAGALPTCPLTQFDIFAAARTPMPLADVATAAGVDLGANSGKGKLRELAQLLTAFGLGNTADPSFAVRAATSEDQVILFPLSDPVAAEPTAAYRSAQLSLMLGMLVGHADSHFHELEKKVLLSGIQSSSALSVDEKSRLSAEIEIHERYPNRLDEWVKKLKDIDGNAKEAVATELVAVAAADGTLHPAEIKKLETLFKRMGLDEGKLYMRLHDGAQGRRGDGDDELEMVIEPGGNSQGAPIPPEPDKRSATRIDLTRLNSIRSETRVTAQALAEIFTEEEAEAISLPLAPEIPTMPDDDDLYEGLERRYVALLTELRSQAEWPAADLEAIVRAAGLMPGAAVERINDWALDRYDELLIEGSDPFEISIHLLPVEKAAHSQTMESVQA
ncbi:hypothetical protein E0H93_29390 [Rhizobium leguminosarum bv. viciae]|uniref:TerB N-terminal domain-containing protein n=1 Tax=Rhizobium leguminosarum TaxID=384 RepID=UPI00103C3AA8|nr:TerB N-terminal domain-containing protein [Rhizobium leguminosarum]TCA99404.1 hypothetical protein E0H93_29390 [Rhizobium leguminosarum bv. viciae]